MDIMQPTKKFVVTITFDADDTYSPLQMERFMEDHMDLHESDHYQWTLVEVAEAPLGY